MQCMGMEWQVADYFFQISNHQSRLTLHELRITNYELRLTNYELRITNYELRITDYELRITDYELRITNYEYATKPQIKKPRCRKTAGLLIFETVLAFYSISSRAAFLLRRIFPRSSTSSTFTVTMSPSLQISVTWFTR